MANKSRGIKGASAVYGATAFGAQAPEAILLGKKIAIVDATPTSILRVSCPNFNVSAILKIDLAPAVNNAGGLESTRCAMGYVVFSRIAGAALVGQAQGLLFAGMASSGSATLTLAYALAAVVGGVTAVNTMDLQVTLTGTGTFQTHQIIYRAALLVSEKNQRMSMIAL